MRCLKSDTSLGNTLGVLDGKETILVGNKHVFISALLAGTMFNVCCGCLCLSEQHFTDVVQGEEFLSLSLQQVCSLISSDKLTVSTEEKVRRHHKDIFIFLKMLE